MATLVFLAYFGLTNLVGFAMMWLDKRRAGRPGARRLRERSLLLVAAVGGSVGVWSAMYAVRHKTHHAAFFYGVPGIIAVQIAGVTWLWLR